MVQPESVTHLLLIILIAFAVGIFIAGVGIAIAVIKARKPSPTGWDWLKDLFIPLITPVIVGALGFWFAIQSDQRQRSETEREREASAMRELIVSQDQRNTSFLLGVDNQLVIHLQRYLLSKQGKEKKPTDFDEEAAFFFYGMHRAALVNLQASEGNLIFPRLWMEEAFAALAQYVVDNIRGAEEVDPNVPPEAEAAIYAYFGVRGETNSSGSEDSRPVGTGPLLLKFHCMLLEKDKPADPVLALEREVLKSEFRNFQERLHNEAFDPGHVIDALIAMQALNTLAYNSTFAGWYGIKPEKIPNYPPSAPPKLFLDTPPKDFGGDWNELRHRTWALILKVCPKAQ